MGVFTHESEVLQQSHQPRCLRLASSMETTLYRRLIIMLLRALSTLKAMVSLVASRSSPLEKGDPFVRPAVNITPLVTLRSQKKESRLAKKKPCKYSRLLKLISWQILTN
ncbi:hypothetical protein Gorai_016173, partial [Gossypium raimondii]|nr:hypothetical protein [Gossypium raimondii]